MGMLLHKHIGSKVNPAPSVEKPEVKAEPKKVEPKPKAKK